MNDLFRRNLKASTIAHFVILLILIIAPLIFNWRVKKKDKEFIQFIDLTVAMPPEMPAIKEVKDIRAPEPPKPKPVMKDIPEPPKKPKVKKSRKKIKRPKPKPKQPQLTQEEIKKLLAAGARASDKTSIGPGATAASWYYSLVRQAMYDAWAQPGSLSASDGLTAEVEIRVQRDGTITRRKMTHTSGNSLMDSSVMQAVESVSKLKPLPPEFGGKHKDITILFELTGAAM